MSIYLGTQCRLFFSFFVNNFLFAFLVRFGILRVRKNVIINLKIILIVDK